MDLDRIDRKILKILQSDGRIKILELAEMVNLSSTPCAKRVKKLEDAGIISGYSANIGTEPAGYPICAFVLIQLKSSSREAANQFAEQISEISAVSECHMTSGSLDYIAKIYAKSLKDYESVIKDDLGKIAVITKVESMIILDNILPTRGLSL